MNCLFIGGSADGQMIDVKQYGDRLFDVRIPVSANRLKWDPTRNLPEETTFEFTEELYRPETYRDVNGNEYAVYVYADVRSPMEQLLNGYASKTAELAAINKGSFQNLYDELQQYRKKYGPLPDSKRW